MVIDFIVAGCTFNDDDDDNNDGDDDRLCICLCSVELIGLITLRGLSMLWFLVDDGLLLLNESLFTVVVVVDLLTFCALYSMDVEDNDNGNGSDGISCSFAVVWLSINGSFMFVEFIW